MNLKRIFNFLFGNMVKDTFVNSFADSKKNNYFYIDESGSISSNSKIFIHGCVKTDSPNELTNSLTQLKQDIIDTVYYDKFKAKFLKDGFHATANTMDMRAEFYKILPILNYRAYFVITKKDSDFFRQQMLSKDESDFFEYSLYKLLKDRILSHKNDKNIFYFETIQLTKRSLKKVLDHLFTVTFKDFECEYHIVDKKEENLAITDYLNFLFSELFTKDQVIQRMKDNVEIVAPKIAVVNFLHNNIILARNKPTKFQVKLENIISNY